MRQNKFLYNSLTSFLKSHPFVFTRIDAHVLIVQPTKTTICFFVNNGGNQIKNPKTDKIDPCDLTVWGDETAGKKQINPGMLLDKDFLANIIQIIWRLEDHFFALNKTKTG